MQQNINLYLAEFRKQKAWLDAARMVQLAGIALGLIVVLSIHGHMQNLEVQQLLATRKALLEETDASVKARRALYVAHDADPALADAIRGMQESLQARQSLLQFMEQRKPGSGAGFSSYLEDLARYHVPGLSLSGITLDNGGASVRLSGQVLQADLVPLYLQNLSKGRAFAGKRFETLQIREVATAGEAQDASAESSATAWLFTVSSRPQ